MPDKPHILLTPSAWLPEGQWSSANESTKRRWLESVASLALSRKRNELRRGLGADGAPLRPVKPSSRPDGATGKPLVPHYGESRTWANLRASTALRTGTVKLYWLGRVSGYGWGTILLFHAQGKVRGAPARDVLGLTPAGERKVREEAMRVWRRIYRPVLKPRQGTVRVPRIRRRPAA